MGYYISFNYNGNNCGILEDKQLDAMFAITEVAKDGHAKWSWVDKKSLLDATDIVELMAELRYGVDLVINENKERVYEITDFYGDKLGNEEDIFTILAPFMSNGYLEYCGEEGDMWRYNFVNGKMIETQGKIVFPDIDFSVRETIKNE